jgi:quinone-modifying oxidoreductase subunit QmoA
VISSVEFERMKDPMGPTGGKILRPGDNKEAKDIAFIQCAGSRDRNYLKHCSRICCMASLKQTTYVSEMDDGKSTIYYIDIRAIDRFEDFYKKVQADEKVSFIKSKPANIVQDKDGNPVIHGVDTEGYHRYANTHDLVVLAIGMEPSLKGAMPEGVDITVNEHGFIENDGSNGGIFAAGCASDALDVNRAVQSATATALKAIQVVNRVAGSEG